MSEARVNMYEIMDMEKRAYRERRHLYGHINFLYKLVGLPDGAAHS